MSDTSLVFNLFGKDKGIGRVLGVIGGAFRSAGQNAETAMDKAKVSTEKLERELDQAKRKIEQLDGATAKAAISQEAAQLRLNAAREKYAALLEKEGATENQKATALNRVKAAELAVAQAAERSNRVQGDREKATSAIGRLEAAIRRAKSGSDDLGDSSDRTGSVLSRLAGFAGNAWSSLSSFGSGLGSVASSVAGLIAILFGLGAALAAIGPVAALAGGALGSLPGLIGGGIAAGATLKLGLGGLSSEYQRLTTATGGSSGAARDNTAALRQVQQAVQAVTRAERDVKDAQKDALAAQLAITEARETASDRLRDQALDLRGAQLDQKDAADAVTSAQNDLNKAVAMHNPDQINQAQEAYDRAVIAAEQAKNRVDDLTEANAKNAKTGVEGSDEVVQAKKREADARRRVADAQQAETDAEQRLADARKASSSGGGGGGGGGQQITKLAPSAKAFLDTIIGLRPAMDRLRLGVQERLFAGLAGRMQHLADVWKGPLTKTLGGFADTFNDIAKTFFSSASKKTFIDNMTAGAGSARKALERIGKAVAGPLMDAFGRLARASGPFLKKIGDLIGGALDSFSKWIRKADETGKLDTFFKNAADMLGKIWDVGGKVLTVVGKLFAIIFPQSMSDGGTALDVFSGALDKISAWLDDPGHQKAIKALFHAMEAPLVSFGKLAFATVRTFGMVKNALTSAYNWVVNRGGKIADFVGALPGRISKASRGMWDGLKNSFRSALNWIIGKWNGFSFTIGGGSFLGAQLPSATLNTPDIPYLARGGTIARAGRAVVGDNGPEILDLPAGARVTPLRAAGGGGGRLVIDITGADSEMKRMIRKWIRVDNLLQAPG